MKEVRKAYAKLAKLRESLVPIGRPVVVALALAVILIALAGSQGTFAQGPERLTPEEAAQVAMEHVAKESCVFPEWEGAVLSEPVPHYDLEGNVSAYVFSVLKDGEDVGYVTVCGVAIPNPILEYSTGEARHKRSLPKCKALAAEKGLTIAEAKPIYLGFLSYYWEVPTEAPGRLLIDMSSTQEIKIPEGQEVIAFYDEVISPEQETDNDTIAPGEADQSVNVTGGSRPGEYTQLPQLDVPDYYQYEIDSRECVAGLPVGPSARCYVGCIPVAAGNVMGYWADRGYPRLMWGGSTGNWKDTINGLHVHMKTCCEGSMGSTLNIFEASGIRGFTEERGYCFWTDHRYTSVSYSEYVNEIDAGRPIIVGARGWCPPNCDWCYGDHTVTGVGYDKTNGEFMIIHDGWEDTAENVFVQFGAGYSSIEFTKAAPRSRVHIDAPRSGQTLSGPFCLWGWAIDPYTHGNGPGISEVHIYVDGPYGTGTWVGKAHYGDPRPDIGGWLGNQFYYSGYHFWLDTSWMSPGQHTLYVYARSSEAWCASYDTVTINVAAGCNVRHHIDHPSPGATLRDTVCIWGWAVDQNSTSGTGINKVTVYPMYGEAYWADEAYYGDPRPDIADWLGQQFYYSGYHYFLDTSNIPAGDHTLRVCAHSSCGESCETVNYRIEAPPRYEVDIWVDKGCGSTYYIGDPIRVYYSVTGYQYIEIYKTTSYGTNLIWSGYRDSGTYYIDGTVGEPTGSHTLTIYGEGVSDECTFYAERAPGTASIEIYFDSGKTCYEPGDTIVMTVRFKYNDVLTDPSWYQMLLYRWGSVYDITGSFDHVSTGVYKLIGTIGDPGDRTLEVKATIRGISAQKEKTFTVKQECEGELTTIFADDFESYSIGAFPSAGGWILWFDGAGSAFVTDEVSLSPTKSFRMDGGDKGVFAAKYFTSVSNVIGYEVYVRVTESKCNAVVSFKSAQNDIPASVWFFDDGIIWSGGKELQPYVVNRWYKIRVILNKAANTYDVWIDDQLKGDDLQTQNSHEIDAFSLGAEWLGPVYYDDVRILEKHP